MEKIILFVLLVFIVGCSVNQMIPDCRHQAIQGAAIVAENGFTPMIAIGDTIIGHRKTNSQSKRPHAQLVTIDSKGEVVNWWAFERGEWIQSQQEVVWPFELVQPEIYYSRMINSLIKVCF